MPQHPQSSDRAPRRTASPGGARPASLLLAVALAACGSGQPPTPAPADPTAPLQAVAGPSTPSPGGPLEPAAPTSSWPRLSAPDAWRPVLDQLRAGAALPKVPREAATSSQELALATARNLTQRLSLRPDDLDLALGLASVYADHLFPDRAAQVLGLCLQLAPEHPKVLKQAAAVLFAQGRAAEASAVLEHAATLAPADQGLAGDLFLVYWELDELEAAQAALLRGLELNPLSPQLALRLGQVLFALDQPEQALPQLRTATEGLPDDTEAWFRYAACLAELGYAEEAEQAKVHHGRLVQMGEFQVPGELTWSERLEVLAQRLEESGDLAGAAALRQP